MDANRIRNWLWLNLLLDKCCDILRQLLEKLWKEKYGKDWSSDKPNADIMLIQCSKIRGLQRRNITKCDIGLWDLTILQAILTENNFPSVSAVAQKNINYLVSVQNKVANVGNNGITDDEFQVHWRKVTSILVAFGELEADLNQLKQEYQHGFVEFLKSGQPFNAEHTAVAHRLKNAGNMQFKKGNWANSVEMYTNALLLSGIPPVNRATLYSNRCAAYLKQGNLQHAMEDAKMTTKLRPVWWRAYFRLGQVYQDMTSYEKAKQCFKEALARQPNNKEIIQELKNVQTRQNEMDTQVIADLTNEKMSWDDCAVEFDRKRISSIECNFINKLKEQHTAFTNSELRNMELCNMGQCYQVGSQGYPKNEERAAQFYKEAADHGSAKGSYLLASLLMEGKEIKQDVHLGIEMFQNAAAKPPTLLGIPNPAVADAENALAFYYHNGIGVKKDLTEAKRWYQRSWEHGSILSAYNLGLLYSTQGDNVKAEEYVMLSAKNGDPRGIRSLADNYLAKGNPKHALFWCQRAKEIANSGVLREEMEKMENLCKTLLDGFRACGVIEWEARNGKASSGMSHLQRLERFHCDNNLLNMSFLKQREDFMKKLPGNERNPSSPVFPYGMLLNYVPVSNSARRLFQAQNHFFNAMAVMYTIIKDGIMLPMDLCQVFVTELASCATIEFIVAQFPGDSYRQACLLVERILELDTTFNENTSICYTALKGLSSKCSINFLKECVEKYPKNAFFLRNRANLFALSGEFEKAVTDLKNSIKLDTFKCNCLFDLADIMRIVHPAVTAQAVIDTYTKYHAKAPKDHRFYPEAYYRIGHIQYDIAKDSLEKKEVSELDLTNVKHFFNLGLEAEQVQLPFFLPYKSNTKVFLEHVLNSIATKNQVSNQ